MKSLCWIILPLLLIGCAASNYGGAKGPDQPLGEESAEIFKATLHPVLVQNCASCHGVSQQPLHSVEDFNSAHTTIVDGGLVNWVDPGESRLVKKIRGGHQGKPQSVADQIESAIESWRVGLETGDGGGGGGGGAVATFSFIHENILGPKCIACHNPDGVRPGTDYTSYVTTMQTGKIKPGDADASAMFLLVKGGLMPKNGIPLTSLELGVLEQWISDGARNN